MSFISKITGFAASKFVECTGKAIKYTKTSGGIPITHYVKTGTEAISSGGVKSVTFGSGNQLSQYAKGFVTYPKGFFGNKHTKTIAFIGENNEPICIGSPEAVKQFFKEWKNLVDVLKAQ